VDNETWIIEAGGDVIEKELSAGLDTLDAWERLVYCLWIADYGMRNAGDLDAAFDIYDAFLTEARKASSELGLVGCYGAFSLSPSELEARYFDLFDSLCNEIRHHRQPTFIGHG
jgi:hypothetical protein